MSVNEPPLVAVNAALPASTLKRRSSTSSQLTTAASCKASLHAIAATESSEDFARRLAKATSDDVNEQNARGQTPLHVAVENEQEANVELLCEISKSRRLTVNTSLQDDHKRTPLHLAVNTGSPTFVQMVLSISREVDHLGPNDRTPLHMAALGRLPEIVCLLLQHGANPLCRDKEDMTPLGMAAGTGSIDLLDAFLSSAGPKLLDMLESTSGYDNSSLLHLAAEAGSPAAVVYLLYKNINRHFRDINGFTAVHVASRTGIPSVLRHLTNSDTVLFDSPSSEGLTPLHEAARHDHVTLVKFLLEKGAKPDRVTVTGASPLLLAATFGAHNTVRLLLSLKVDCLKKDHSGANVLHCAVGHRQTLQVLAEILEPRGVFEELVHGQDCRGASALHYAADHGRTSDVTFLVEHGASPDVVEENGLTSLHVAARRGHLHIVAKLSRYAPREVNVADAYGRSPLHMASLYGHTKVVCNLLRNGANLSLDRDGRTELHYAAWHGSVACMKVLLSAFKPSLDATDSQKATSLHLAVVADHPDMIEYLLDQNALVTDNKSGQNGLDVAIAFDREACASVFVNHERWRESMKPLGNGLVTQLQLLVEKMPEVALVVMDKCVVVSSGEKKETERVFDFRYMQGITDESTSIPPMASTQLLESMANCKRIACMSHPLCVEFLNSKWRKFGAAAVMMNISVYMVFLLLLTVQVIEFPAYSPFPLDLLSVAQKENRKTLSLSEKADFCYGTHGIRLAVILAAGVGLLKEIIPILYERSAYLKRLSNGSELAVYVLCLVFLDPFGVILQSYDVPVGPCPKIVWEIGAVTVFLAWLVLLLNLRRLPFFGIYIVMILSMFKTMIQVLVVVSLFILGFALSFYMLLNNEASFRAGGHAIMKTVVMSVGDLAYEEVLPPRVDNVTSQYPAASMVQTDDSPIILFPSLSYLLYICFAILMPVVVLNVLIGLAVGDIAAVRADAALRQIVMQIKLVVQLERALPSWILRHVQVPSCVKRTKEEKTLRGWVRRVIKAADEPDTDKKSPLTERLAEVKHNHRQLDEWLTNIQYILDHQTALLKSLAACIRREEKQAAARVSHPVSSQPTGDGHAQNEELEQQITQLVEQQSIAMAPLREEMDEEV